MFQYRRSPLWLCAILTTACLWPSAALAGPVDPAVTMPEDTLLYIGRAGSEQTEKFAKSTSYGKLTADPSVKRFFSQLHDAIDGFIVMQMGNEDASAYRICKGLLETLYKRPTAFAVLDGGVGDQGPYVEAALVSHIGDDADRFLDDFEDFMDRTNGPPRQAVTVGGHKMTQVQVPAPIGFYFGVIKGHFVLAAGEQTVRKIGACIQGEGASLAESKALKTSRSKMRGDADARSTTVFANTALLVKRIESILPMMPDFEPSDAEKVKAMLNNLGVDSLKSVCWESRFIEGGCYSGLYLYTPGGGRGLFSNSKKALTESDLAMIPKSPSWAMANNMNISAIYQGLLALVKAIDAGASQMVMGFVQQIEQTLGFKLDEEFLGLMGDTIIVYDAPENGGLWFTGITKIIESRDPKQLQKRLGQIANTIAGLAGARETVKINSFEHRDHRIEFVNTIGFPMPVAPAWTTHEKWVIVALYPQMVTTALDRILDGDAAKDSILANDDFKKARKMMGDLGPSVSYVDTQETFAGLYPWLLAIGQVGAAMAQGEGVEIDVTALPSQQTVAKYLFNDVKMTQCDSDGTLHSSFGPLPMGANPLMLSYANSAPIAMAVSVLLPSLSRARELSKRTVCAANLRGIGQALYIHAMDDEKFPPDFETLLKAGDVTEKQFVCPSTTATPGDPLDSCYVYIPGQTTSSDPRNVLVYERPHNHTNNEGANVLFQDGHVEFVMPYSRVEQLVRETNERLSK